MGPRHRAQNRPLSGRTRVGSCDPSLGISPTVYDPVSWESLASFLAASSSFAACCRSEITLPFSYIVLESSNDPTFTQVYFYILIKAGRTSMGQQRRPQTGLQAGLRINKYTDVYTYIWIDIRVNRDRPRLGHSSPAHRPAVSLVGSSASAGEHRQAPDVMALDQGGLPDLSDISGATRGSEQTFLR